MSIKAVVRAPSFLIQKIPDESASTPGLKMPANLKNRHLSGSFSADACRLIVGVRDNDFAKKTTRLIATSDKPVLAATRMG